MKAAALAAASRVAAGGVDCQVRVTAVAGAGPSRVRAARTRFDNGRAARPNGAQACHQSPEVDDESGCEGGDDCQRHGVAARARGRCRRGRAQQRADAGLQPGRSRLRLRHALLDRRPARGAGHLVLLDRRQREVLGADGGAHRGQRQPARRTWTRGCTAAGSRRSARSPSRDAAPQRRPTSTGCGWISASSRPSLASPATRPASSDSAASPIRSSTRPPGTPRATSSTREDGAAVPHRHGVRVLPRRLQPAEPAGERRGAQVVEPRRRDRQSVLGRGPPLQPAHAADRLPLARRQPAATGDVRHVTLRDRSHQQSERDQPRLQPRVPADRAREDGGWLDPSGAPHPQGWRRLDRRRRRVAARLREHRHVLGLLADAARPGERAPAAAAVPDRERAQELRGLAQHRSADGERRGVSQDAGADAPQRCSGRRRASQRERRDAAHAGSWHLPTSAPAATRASSRRARSRPTGSRWRRGSASRC